jgi:FkbM family methyltransferase
VRKLLNKSVSLVPWKLRNAIKKIPLLAPLQRRLLRRFLEGQEFLHTVDAGPARGLNYLITLPQDKGIWTGTYELQLAERIAEVIRPSDVCFDIGGWHGFFSGLMALHGASKVFVFEPLPANARQIRKMIELNPDLPIELIEVALGDQAGTAQLRVLPETSMAKLSNSSFQSFHQKGDIIEVRLDTLDHLKEAELFARANVIKMDIEGAEAMALRGAKDLLQTDRPSLFIEVHSRALARECSKILADQGYFLEVIETGREPDFFSEPDLCHLAATARR